MAINHEDYNPDLKYGAVETETNLAISDGKILVGDSDGLGAEVNISGDATMTNAGVLSVTNFTREAEVVSGATETVLVTDSGKVYFASAASGTTTFTLPAAAAGLIYTFIATNAGGEILIDQAGSEVIVITTFAAVGADADTAIVTTAAGTGIKNTAATNAIGDSITLISDGTKWFSLGITTGIWASQ